MQVYPEYQIGHYFCSAPKAATAKAFSNFFSFGKYLLGNMGILNFGRDMCKGSETSKNIVQQTVNNIKMTDIDGLSYSDAMWEQRHRCMGNINK